MDMHDPSRRSSLAPSPAHPRSHASDDQLWLYKVLVDAVRDYAIFALDPTGHVLTWNTGAQRIKGYAAEEIIGHHFSRFYPPEKVAERFPQYELQEAARVGRFEDEGWRLRKDGSRFWANVVITAVRDADGRLVGYAKVTRDLTERRAAQQRELANERRAAEAEAANRAKSEFLTTLSHELRTPLNAIGGYAELLALGLGGPVTEEQRDYTDRIRRSQQHLLGIINDLLNYSRIDAGRVGYEMAPVALAEVSAAVLPMIEPQATARGVALLPAECDEAVVAVADRAKVEQILLNLLSNAVKFTGTGGRVMVSCAAADGVVTLSVVDTGVGVPADKLEAIFEPFVQLGRTLTTSHEGTGLGLAISRDLARAMGGDLTVASTLGEGSTFTLTLPAA